MRRVFCGAAPRSSGEIPVFGRRSTMALCVLFLLAFFASELRAEEFLAASLGRRDSIRIMSRELASAMKPWRIRNPIRKSTEYARHIWDAHEIYSVDPFLITALICVESEGRIDARTHTRVGLMQISVQDNMQWIPNHFPHIKTVNDLMKLRNNVMVGTFILSTAMQGTRTTRQALYKYLGREDEKQVDKMLDIVRRMNTAALAGL